MRKLRYKYYSNIYLQLHAHIKSKDMIQTLSPVTYWTEVGVRGSRCPKAKVEVGLVWSFFICSSSYQLAERKAHIVCDVLSFPKYSYNYHLIWASQ